MGDSFLESILAASVALLVLLAIIGVVLFVVSFVRTNRQKNHFASVHQSLACGQRIMLADGIYGDLVRVGQETCDMRVKSGAVLEVSRFAIQQVDTNR